MKTRTLLFITSLLLATSYGYGQDKKEDKKEYKKAEKIAYITSQLELTPEEAEKFWPIFNEYTDKAKALKEEVKANHKDKKISELSDAEVENFIQAHMNLQEKELALKRSYHEKFKSVLPVKKIAKLYHLEHEFRKPPHPPKPPHNHNHEKKD